MSFCGRRNLRQYLLFINRRYIVVSICLFKLRIYGRRNINVFLLRNLHRQNCFLHFRQIGIFNVVLKGLPENVVFVKVLMVVDE
jgi:hypothetical protein